MTPCDQTKDDCHCDANAGPATAGPAGDAAAAAAAAAPRSAADATLAERCKKYPRYIPDPRVDTSALYATVNLPDRFERSYVFKNYGVQLNDCANPLYRTTSSEYGWYFPNAHTVPQRFHPRTNEFSDLLGKCGMYRNYSLNTAMDASVF